MTVLEWDQTGERLFETGVDHGVLYLPDNDGNYDDAHPWNGLVTVTESPSGAESNPQFADNIKYLNLLSAEEFGATIEAFTYPDAFAECDGTAIPSAGVLVGQQGRKVFGLAYRTKLGNDLEGADHGYKLHLIYGCQAAPSEKAYGTINDSPEAITFSWEVTTQPVPVTNLSPSAQLVIDSTKVDAGDLEDLTDILFGTVGDDARLPLPDEVIAIFGAGEVAVNMATDASHPTFVDATGVLTLPAVTGVRWTVNGTTTASGVRPAIAAGATIEVEAHAQDGYNLVGDDEWTFQRDA